jgi:hypothetical protein
MVRGLIAVLLLLLSLTASAQRDVFDNSKLSDRLYFGGGLGLNAGTDPYAGQYFYVALFPIIGYMVSSQFSVGTGITYQYYSYSDIGQEIHQYGVSPFARYNFGQLFLYGEYSLLSTPTFYGPTSKRKVYDRLLLGLGFSQPLGGRGSLNVMGLYDVIWKQSDFAFTSPWVFRVFVSF